MEIQVEYLYVLFLLLIIPRLYFLYSKYNKEKKDSILKDNILEGIDNIFKSRSWFFK